jgi:hypothetical protein
VSGESINYTITYVHTVTLRDMQVATLQPSEVGETPGYTSSKISYTVRLPAIPDRGEPFFTEQKSVGLPHKRAVREIFVRVHDLDMAKSLASALRRAAVLCGAPDEPLSALVPKQ